MLGRARGIEPRSLVLETGILTYIGQVGKVEELLSPPLINRPTLRRL